MKKLHIHPIDMIPHPTTSGFSPVMGSAAEQLDAKKLSDFMEELLNNRQHKFFTAFDGNSRFVEFVATLEKPRTINNLAGGHPATYQLKLSSSMKYNPLSPTSAHSVGALFFSDWCEEKTKELGACGVKVNNLSSSLRITPIVIAFTTDNHAAIDALDGLIDRHANSLAR